MSDYTFHTLNDKEFEALANDLYSAKENTHVERFKPGKDAGIDGRFFVDNNKQVVIQSKHWLRSGIKKLISALKENELPKVRSINPHSYILFTSLDLSPADKRKIHDVFSEYMRSESDIYGCSDINALISKFPDVERTHYKLWLASSGVLQTLLNNSRLTLSGYVIQEALALRSFYVRTSNHLNAVDKLEKLHAIIITGEPGIGKTTLAEQISLEYFSNGFEFINISESIEEAYGLIKNGKKQLFYFDDFLGSNYLLALNKNEDSKIVRFINIARTNDSTRFILTSRTSIYNQGMLLGDKFITGNIQKNEYELNANSISLFEKACILYNRIWHSNLSNEYIDIIYKNKNYHAIIKHRNYSPRLIQYLTDMDKLCNIAPENYWEYIMTSLNNPKDIWDHPFTVQLSDFERALVLLVSYNGSPIDESHLRFAFLRYLSALGNESNADLIFRNALRIVTKSFLVRYIENNIVKYKLSNPSISDYIFSYYNSMEIVLNISLAMQSPSMIYILASPGKKFINYSEYLIELLDFICSGSCEIMNVNFFIRAIYYGKELGVDLSEYNVFIKKMVESIDINEDSVDIFYLNVIGLLSEESNYVDLEKMQKILTNLINFGFDVDEMSTFIDLYNNISSLKSESMDENIYNAVLGFLESNIYDIIDDKNVMEKVHISYVDLDDGYYENEYDDDEVIENITMALQDEASAMGVDIDHLTLRDIAKATDYQRLIDAEINAQSRSGGGFSSGRISYGDDKAIDDLFEKN